MYLLPQLPLKEQSYLLTLLNQPLRYYHNSIHINKSLLELHDYCNNNLHQITGREIFKLIYAIWYHDVIYDPYAPKGYNEKMSAELFYESYNNSFLQNNFTSDELLEISNIIESTKDFIETKFLDLSNRYDLILAIMLDIDLAGFGKPWAEFSFNSENIKKEYYLTHYYDYYKNRLNFLNLLKQNRSSLYYTDYFKNKYDDISKQNIEREIRDLESKIDNANMYR